MRCFIYGVARVLATIVGILLMQGCQSKQPEVDNVTRNVEVLEKIFIIPGLNRERKLRIYLPPDYYSPDRHLSNQRYPVLYMHDAQNLFDDATSYVGEWGVDETLNNLAKEKGLSLIVVGVDNGQEKRMNELSPWKNDKFGDAEGKVYMDFIVNIIKPYIDQNYRTLSDQKNTAIMGSSMGGLISHYAIFNYPQIFSKAGIFSPSFWFSEEVYDFSQPSKLSQGSRLYFLIGGKEGVEDVADVNKMTAQIINQGLPKEKIKSKVVADGEHNEKFWRSEFGEAVLWLFAK